MAASGGGGWSLSDLSDLIGTATGVGGMLVSVGTFLHLRGRQSAGIDDAKRHADDALKKVDDLAKDMNICRLNSIREAKEFVTRAELAAFEDRIGARIDSLGTRVEASMSRLGERIDRIAEK